MRDLNPVTYVHLGELKAPFEEQAAQCWENEIAKDAGRVRSWAGLSIDEKSRARWAWFTAKAFAGWRLKLPDGMSITMGHRRKLTVSYEVSLDEHSAEPKQTLGDRVDVFATEHNLDLMQITRAVGGVYYASGATSFGDTASFEKAAVLYTQRGDVVYEDPVPEASILPVAVASISGGPGSVTYLNCHTCVKPGGCKNVCIQTDEGEQGAHEYVAYWQAMAGLKKPRTGEFMFRIPGTSRVEKVKCYVFPVAELIRMAAVGAPGKSAG